MKQIYIVFFIITAAHAAPLIRLTRQATTTTTPRPKPTFKAALHGQELIGTLRRALDIAVRAPKAVKRPHRDDYGDQARELLRFLTQDPDYAQSSSSSQESAKQPEEKRRRYADDDFCEPSTSWGTNRRTSLQTMQRIVSLVDVSKRTEAQMRHQYPWYRRQYLADFRRCIEQGGSHSMKRDQINTDVAREVRNILSQNLPLKTYMIRAFARRSAARNDASWFRAGPTWIKSFKKKNRLSSRKATKIISRPQIENREEIEENMLEFLNDYARLSRSFPSRFIWNIDQTGIEYESSNQRVVARTGSRDVMLRVDSLNKNTHTFTAQPILTRDGRLLGRLALCLRESTGEFGPIVGPSIRQLADRYGNVAPLSSTSGKMTVQLMRSWMRDVLRPTLERQLNSASNQNSSCEQSSCSSSTRGKRLMLLADSWGGNRNEDVLNEVDSVLSLTIPAHTTDTLQPLDVGFFRQLKIFIRRITEEALIADRIGDITSREGVLNLMSLIYNQLQSPAYHDLWKFAWRNTDPYWSESELSVSPPSNVNSIQFGSELDVQCQVENCTNPAVVRCSHCGESICLNHFLERTHFHEINDEGDRIEMEMQFGPGIEYEDDDEDEEEEELIYLESPRNQTITTTSTARPSVDIIGVGPIPFMLSAGSFGRKK